jgi:hypothetical protein
MPLKPKFKTVFWDKLNSDEFKERKQKILGICNRLCSNPRAANGHQLRYKLNHLWAADIPYRGRGGDRIIFQIHCKECPDVPKDEIWFIDITDYH